MQIIYPPSSGGYAATFSLGGGRFRADGIHPYPALQCLLWPPAAPIQNRFFMWGATTPARHGTTSQVCHPEAERSNPRPPSPDVPSSVMAYGHDTFPPQGGRFYRRRFLRPSPLQGEGGPQGRMRVRFESGLARLGSRAPRIKGRGMELRLTPKHLTCAAATGIPDSATTSRHPPTQAAKKCWIEPRLFPVPPAESTVDGAGALRGRKDGPPDSYLGPLNPHGSPFFFGFQKPFFFRQGKRNGL